MRELCITYRSTKEATWRCHFFVLFHHWPSALTFFAVPLVGSLVASVPFINQDIGHNLLLFIRFLGGASIIWSVVFACGLWAEIQRRFPTRDTIRICTTCLTPEGVRDTTPDGEKLHAWSSIRSIREHNGDLHFWLRINGLFIPREAWKDVQEAEAFCEAARIIWESNCTLWPE